MTVRQLLASIDSAELTEWQAFERLEPFGALADDNRLGTIAATMANVHRRPDSRPEPYQPTDFMPPLAAEVDRRKARAATPTPASPKARSASLAAMIFGRVRK